MYNPSIGSGTSGSTKESGLGIRSRQLERRNIGGRTNLNDNEDDCTMTEGDGDEFPILAHGGNGPETTKTKLTVEATTAQKIANALDGGRGAQNVYNQAHNEAGSSSLMVLVRQIRWGSYPRLLRPRCRRRRTR